jgi:Transglycosylase SLT domain
MKKLLILLMLTGCNVKIPAIDTAKPSSQDTTTVEPAPVAPPKELTLKEKLSATAKDFEKLETSYLPFCKNTPKDLNLFYTTLFYEMIRHESGFKKEEAYYECAKAKCYYSSGCFEDPVRGFCRITSNKLDGGFAVSRGLFQLSVSSVRSLGCKDYIQVSQDLHDPDKNIKCAATIMKNYIISDKIITGKDGDKWRGLSRYWSVLRPTFDGKERKSYTSIVNAVQKVSGCN